MSRFPLTLRRESRICPQNRNVQRLIRKVESLGQLHVDKAGPDKTPVQKVSFATRVGDLGCGVGYYN
jgi:hypothetical protein